MAVRKWSVHVLTRFCVGGRVLLDFRQEFYGQEVGLDDLRELLGLPLSNDNDNTVSFYST